jgi:hypothetical protein
MDPCAMRMEPLLILIRCFPTLRSHRARMGSEVTKEIGMCGKGRIEAIGILTPILCK